MAVPSLFTFETDIPQDRTGSVVALPRIAKYRTPDVVCAVSVLATFINPSLLVQQCDVMSNGDTTDRD